MPKDALFQASEDYSRIARALQYFKDRSGDRPDFRGAADAVGLSEFHFHRMFKRWAGITPKQFTAYLSVDHAKRLLLESHSVLDAAYDAGLSGPGRLHDLFVTLEAVTPGEFKEKGSGLVIQYGFHPTPFGLSLTAATERGVCGLSFLKAGEEAKELRALKESWPGAVFIENGRKTGDYIQRIFSRPGSVKKQGPLPLTVRGTNFQIKVWEALLKVPSGCVISYSDLARRMGMPRAARAVGSAVAMNPAAYLIPCHRVIKSMGICGKFRWDAPRKQAMLAWEAARAGGRG